MTTYAQTEFYSAIAQPITELLVKRMCFGCRPTLSEGKKQIHTYFARRRRDEMIGQIPQLKKKFVRYTPYSSATINDIFTAEQLKGSITLTANTFQTIYMVNENKKFVAHPLPYQVQLAPVFAMVVEDFNQDGRKDILMAGNFIHAETETADMDAGNGTLLLQNQDGSFRFVLNIDHGFWAQDEVWELKLMKRADGKKEIVTVNNKGPLQLHILTNSTGLVQ